MNAMLAPESIDAIRARKADHRTEASDLRMELTARRLDALELVEAAQPFLSRLELVAHEVGPVAYQHVAALRSLLARHARQWDDTEGGAA